MAWIKTVAEPDAEGLLRREYDKALKRAGKIYHIVSISSLRPDLIRSSIAFYVAAMHGQGELTRAQREMLAVVVSQVNDCFY